MVNSRIWARFSKRAGSGTISVRSYKHTIPDVVPAVVGNATRRQDEHLPNTTSHPPKTSNAGPVVYSAYDENVPKCTNSTKLFQFGNLPFKVQERILMDVAVTSRLESETFREVYGALAPVCKQWTAMMKNPMFYEEVKERVFQKGLLDICMNE